VGLWSKIFGKKDGEVPVAAPIADVGAPTSAMAREAAEPELGPDLARLARLGQDGGPTTEEAMSTFRHLRTTPDEARAIEVVLERAQQVAVPEPLLVAVASALSDRGEPEPALKALATCDSSSALLLRADLEADRGEVAAALVLAERVLLRELDHPGARERHTRWREALGLAAPTRMGASTATVVTAEPDTPYRLMREIARGGAGAVYEAEDRDLGRHVALKVYHEPTRDRDQLLHEARVAVALSGPGVVRVFDLDPEQGWIALEYTPLGSLREHVRTKNAKVLGALDVGALTLALALARVHDAGWVHLDVKPANVLVLAPELPVLTDFGIARRRGEPSPAGSMGYVSPERIAGRAADPKDDVFGFGRVLEDALDALQDPTLEAKLRPLARACTGPDANRPAHARELVTRLRALQPQ
jgi:serine/threonine-protein kinase